MNITTQARFSIIILMLTATVAIATASAAPDQTATVQINPMPIYHASRSVASVQMPEQRIALLVLPTTTRPQARNWNNPQPALSAEHKTANVKASTPDDGAIVLATVSVHPRPTMIQWIGHKVSSLLP